VQFKAPKPSHLIAEIQAGASLERLAETQETLRRNKLEAQQRVMKYTSKKQITFNFGDKVSHLTRHFQTTTPSKKLDNKGAALYNMSKIINRNA
jgi:hypothetical protein